MPLQASKLISLSDGDKLQTFLAAKPESRFEVYLLIYSKMIVPLQLTFNCAAFTNLS